MEAFVVRVLSILQKHSFYSFPSTKRPFTTIHSTNLLLISLTTDLKKYGWVLSKLNSYFHCTLCQTFRNYTVWHFTLILELSEGWLIFFILYHFKTEAKKCLHVSKSFLHIVSLFVLQHKLTFLFYETLYIMHLTLTQLGNIILLLMFQ